MAAHIPHGLPFFDFCLLFKYDEMITAMTLDCFLIGSFPFLKSKDTELFLTPREQVSNYGFSVWHARPRKMDRCHHHNDVEVNYLVRGGYTYLFGGSLVKLSRGDIAIFWAARPHQVVATSGKPFFQGFSVPLGWVLNWEIPRSFAKRLLNGAMLLSGSKKLANTLNVRSVRWLEDMRQDSIQHRKVMLLEMESWLRRVAIQLGELENTKDGIADSTTIALGLDKVERMARYINERYRDPIGVRDVAAAVDLHPNYAVSLFRNKTGSTLVDFLTKQRLAHAQLLLATTDAPVRDVAVASGFGSPSRFYAVFKRSLSLSPNEYRDALLNPRV